MTTTPHVLANGPLLQAWTDTVADGAAVGTILNDDVTLISAVQGTGAASPLAGRTVTVEAIVVGDFQTGDGDARRNLGALLDSAGNAFAGIPRD